VVEEDARKLDYRNWRADVKDKVAGDICLRRLRPTQGCRADDDDDDDEIPIVIIFRTVSVYRFG
jgi:hypothetical protein